MNPPANRTFKTQYRPKIREDVVVDPVSTTDSTPQPLHATNQNQICILCANPIVSFSLGKCNHNDCCSTCIYRLRRFMKSKSCPTCRCEQEAVVFSPSNVKMFNEYTASDFTTEQIDRTLGIFYEDSALQRKINHMNAPICPICTNTFATVQLLQHHLRYKHDKEYCLLCVEKRPLFLSEQSLYTPKTIILHRQGQLQDDISGGHPFCQFCKTHHFDTESFRHHMNSTHEKCFLCEGVGITTEYYPNYYSLQAHFRKSHHFCENVECIQNRYVVFATELELIQHQTAIHGKISSSDVKNKSDIRVNHNSIQINLNLLQSTDSSRSRRRREDYDELSSISSQSLQNLFVDPAQFDVRMFPSLTGDDDLHNAPEYHPIWKHGRINQELFPSLPGAGQQSSRLDQSPASSFPSLADNASFAASVPVQPSVRPKPTQSDSTSQSPKTHFPTLPMNPSPLLSSVGEENTVQGQLNQIGVKVENILRSSQAITRAVLSPLELRVRSEDQAMKVCGTRRVFIQLIQSVVRMWNDSGVDEVEFLPQLSRLKEFVAGYLRTRPTAFAESVDSLISLTTELKSNNRKKKQVKQITDSNRNEVLNESLKKTRDTMKEQGSLKLRTPIPFKLWRFGPPMVNPLDNSTYVNKRFQQVLNVVMQTVVSEGLSMHAIDDSDVIPLIRAFRLTGDRIINTIDACSAAKKNAGSAIVASLQKESFLWITAQTTIIHLGSPTAAQSQVVEPIGSELLTLLTPSPQVQLSTIRKTVEHCMSRTDVNSFLDELLIQRTLFLLYPNCDTTRKSVFEMDHATFVKKMVLGFKVAEIDHQLAAAIITASIRLCVIQSCLLHNKSMSYSERYTHAFSSLLPLISGFLRKEVPNRPIPQTLTLLGADAVSLVTWNFEIRTVWNQPGTDSYLHYTFQTLIDACQFEWDDYKVILKMTNCSTLLESFFRALRAEGRERKDLDGLLDEPGRVKIKTSYTPANKNTPDEQITDHIPFPPGLEDDRQKLFQSDLIDLISSDQATKMLELNTRVLTVLHNIISPILDEKTVEDVMTSFVTICHSYRRRNTTATRWFSGFYGLFGEEGVQLAFDDLVAILPVPELRTALVEVRQVFDKTKPSQAKLENSSKPAKQDKQVWQIDFRTVLTNPSLPQRSDVPSPSPSPPHSSILNQPPNNVAPLTSPKHNPKSQPKQAQPLVDDEGWTKVKQGNKHQSKSQPQPKNQPKQVSPTPKQNPKSVPSQPPFVHPKPFHPPPPPQSSTRSQQNETDFPTLGDRPASGPATIQTTTPPTIAGFPVMIKTKKR
ncbi:putative E3 ubiquitin-protein ligase hel2 [Blattamonas nauphoetae]|uniref:E3 ubiquitin-protein ligase hel2 n=1 Tax=Blattamonas nauphoetae TaxID=2049346 RepID=A0ABQ9XWF9_9EUKA|nr:putative E3 ubiquitin-protein ligase hel2 [Blattamonas nauphoetae]